MPQQFEIAPFEGEDLLYVEVPEQSIKIVAQPIFQEILDQIPQVIDRGRNLLDNYSPETVDESDIELTDLLKEINTIRGFNRNIDDSLKNLRSVFDHAKKETQGIVEDQLNAAGFDQLTELAQDLNRFKKELQAVRKRQRWQEVKGYYLDTLKEYPNLTQHLPKQSDFQSFYAQYEEDTQFVSGAQQWTFNDKRKGTVNQHLVSLNQDLSVILSLKSPFQEELLDRYDTQPILANVVDFNDKLIQREAKRKEEIERAAKAKAEREAKLELEKRLAEERAKLQAKQKTQTTIKAAKRPKERMAKPGLSDAPFGLATPQQKLNRVLDHLGRSEVKAQITQNALSPVTAMVLIKAYINGIFDKDKTLQSITQNPQEVLDTIQLLINATPDN